MAMRLKNSSRANLSRFVRNLHFYCPHQHGCIAQGPHGRIFDDGFREVVQRHPIRWGLIFDWARFDRIDTRVKGSIFFGTWGLPADAHRRSPHAPP